uniref:Sushi domain-containing protein n=1 Tax=Mustela putorius furo TaxID=9669 RepID=M3YL48_MUSPF
ERCLKSEITIENGFFSESELAYPLNNKTQYQCKSGYVTPDGTTSGSVTCLENGWSPQPTCIKQYESCDMPGLENAKIRSNSQLFKVNDTLDYECLDGFESRDGRAGSIVCGNNGWSHTPECYEIECKVPEVEENLIADPRKDKYRVGDVLRFSCRSRLKRVGPDSVQCYHFGWSPNLPTCKVSTQSCPPPPQIPNAQNMATTVNYQDGEKVSVVCQDNYIIQGAEEIVCQDGSWQSIPRCADETEKLGCPQPPPIEHGTIKSLPLHKSDTYQDGEEIVYKCEEGFGTNGSASIKCLGGKWSHPPECINSDISCENPPKVENAIILDEKPRYLPGETARYECTEPFELFGEVEVTCLDGYWSQPPQCAVDCVVIIYIYFMEDLTTLGQLESCIIGGDIIIPFPIIQWGCLGGSVGYFNVTPFCNICNETYLNLSLKKPSGKCVSPPSIDNGDITSFPLAVYAPGSSVQYKCLDFYVLQGPRTVTCRNGKWSTPPKCLAEPCRLSAEMMRRQNIRFRWTHDTKMHYSATGDVIEFDCLRGYRRKTPAHTFRAICQDGKLLYPEC